MFDAEFYGGLSDDKSLFNLSEKQIYLIGQAVPELILDSQWTGDTSVLDLDSIAGQLEFDIANEITIGGEMAVETKDVSLSVDFDISGTQSSYPIVWDTGDYDNTNNSRVYVENSGRFIITSNLDINSAGGNRAEPELWVNGAIYSRLILASGGNRSYSMTTTLNLAAGDYVEIRVTTNGSVSIATDVFASRMNLTGFFE